MNTHQNESFCDSQAVTFPEVCRQCTIFNPWTHHSRYDGMHTGVPNGPQQRQNIRVIQF